MAHGLCSKHGGRLLCPEPDCRLKVMARGRCKKHDLAFNPHRERRVLRCPQPDCIYPVRVRGRCEKHDRAFNPK